MTAMKKQKETATSKTGDSKTPVTGNDEPITARTKQINDRKFAFLNQITRPDYRSLPTSTTTSQQNSLPSTPVTAPIMMVLDVEFREFRAPIATPEDEDIEMKSEPVFPSKRFEPSPSSVPKNEDDDEKTMKVEQTTEVEIFEPLEKQPEAHEESEEHSTATTTADVDFSMEISEEVIMGQNMENGQSCSKSSSCCFENMEEKEEEEEQEHQEIEDEEYRKMTESFGEPRKAVLETVTDYEDEDDDDEEDDEEEMSIPTRSSSNFAELQEEQQMVFGIGKLKEKVTKPMTLALKSSNGSGKSEEKKRAEFCIDPDDQELRNDDGADESCQFDPSTSSNADETVLQQSLLQLQKQLRKSDVKCSRLEKICEFQQKDIDSLRFEMDWKDKRIEFLQQTLEQMEHVSKSQQPQQ